jgi:hypothetical protein
VVPAPDKTQLKFRHGEGTSATVQTTSKIHQTLTIANMDIETSQESRSTISSSVGKRAANGRLPIDQKVDALAIQVTAPNVNLSFDSNSPNTQNDNPMLQAILESIAARVGPAHTVVLDKDNKVVAIEGADKILQRATPAAAELLRRDIDPEKMRKSVEQGYSVLPSEPVSEGDTWTRTMTNRIGGGQTLTFETRFEYQGTVEKFGKKLHKIAVTAQSVAYAQDDNPQAQLKVLQSNLKVESSKGTILFDNEKGQTVENTSLTRVAGDMTFSINGMDFPGKLDLTMDSNSVLQK